MKRSLTVAALSGLLLVVTACGSDDDGVTVEQSERGEDADTPDPAPASSDDTGSGTGDDEGDSGDPADVTLPGDLPGSIDGECADLYEEFQGAISGVSAADPDLSGVEDAFDSLADRVPDELADDVEVLADVFGDFAALLEEYEGDYAELVADPDALDKLSALQSPEVLESQENLSTYFAETCPELEELG